MLSNVSGIENLKFGPQKCNETAKSNVVDVPGLVMSIAI